MKYINHLGYEMEAPWHEIFLGYLGKPIQNESTLQDIENFICTQCGQIGKHFGTVNGMGFYICYEPDRKAVSCVSWKNNDPNN